MNETRERGLGKEILVLNKADSSKFRVQNNMNFILTGHFTHAF